VLSELVDPHLACSTEKTGRGAQACRIFVEKLKRMAERAQEQAKLSLFQEGGHP
jgi:hypothetical protein